MKKSDVLQLALCVLSMVLIVVVICGGIALNGKKTGGGFDNAEKCEFLGARIYVV